MRKVKGVTIDECVIGQEYWLDDCMDDSGIYAGNGKWIPVFTKLYIIGEDGLIMLDKGLFYPKSNNAKLELENKIRIPIPKNHTAKIENNTVIFELKTGRFKEGDFVKIITRSNTWLVILSRIDSKRRFIPYCAFAPSDEYLSIGNNVRFPEPDENRVSKMTDSEKQILLDKLHEAGKDWDAEKCKIVDWVWKPKSGDLVYYITQFESVGKIIYIDGGDIRPFRTQELAEAALELLKQAKHY